MKIGYIAFAILLLTTVQLRASGEDSLVGTSENYIEMRGRVLESFGQSDDEKKGLDSAVYTVTNESGKMVISGAADSKGKLSFKLPLGRKFTLNFTKKGYVRKMILVDTHVPADARKAYTFTYDVDIFAVVKGLDVSVLNKPVARVTYKPIDKTFGYDAAYTNKVNAALQKMYRDYYTLRRKEDIQHSDSASPAKKNPKKKKF